MKTGRILSGALLLPLGIVIILAAAGTTLDARVYAVLATVCPLAAGVVWRMSKDAQRGRENAEKGGHRKESRDEREEYYAIIKKVFTLLAPFYDIVTLPLSRVRERVVGFANAGSGAKLLDVGTGTGKQAFAFAKKGHEVIGIDLSEAMLKVADKNNKYENVKFLAADAAHLPFADGSFDVSCASFALHDMLSTIREEALKEMVRVTKPKGMLVIVDYALPKNKACSFIVYHFVELYEGKYYREFIKTDLAALLGRSGFRIQEELPVLCGAGKIIKGFKGG